MSNFQCDKCGMINIDCGKDGFKTPREIKLEVYVKELKEQLELNTANAVVIDMAQRLYKLKQTLTEIKEIAEPFCNACQEFEPEKKGSNCIYCNYGEILQKISECEVNND